MLQRSARVGDRVTSGLAVGAGLLIVITLAGVALFLLAEGMPALTADPQELPGGRGFLPYVGPLLFGTLLSSAIALVIAAPLAVGVALFITHYTPRALSATLGYLIDLLAAVPSVVYGLWGATLLGPVLVPITVWLVDNLGWIPLFAGPASVTGGTMLTAGMVLAIMILPIITALCREVFLQTPRLHEEAALALGATHWEMIKVAVLPYGRSGIVSAAMLGLGRALGETMAVALVLSVSGGITVNLVSRANPSTIAANIALEFPESTGLEVNTLIATGLVLFAVTFLVNWWARSIVIRRTVGQGVSR